MFVGLDPNTAFLEGTLELDRWGFVVTDDRYETSLPGVYAAGDVRTGSTKQLGAAAGEGIAALLSIREHLRCTHEVKDPVAGMEVEAGSPSPPAVAAASDASRQR